MTEIALFLLLGFQSWSGEPGRAYSRPNIPDPSIIHQDWIQPAIGLSKREREVVGSEFKGGYGGGPSERWLDTMPETKKIYERHAKRILEVSLWIHDIFSISNPYVSNELLGLSKPQQEAVDRIMAVLFRWRSEFTSKINFEGRTFDARGGPTDTRRWRLIPDDFVLLKRTMLARWELRRVLTPEQQKQLRRLKGDSPGWGPMGFPFKEQFIYNFTRRVGTYRDPLFMTRVHEELGFSMKQSRLLFQTYAQNKDRESEFREEARRQLSARRRARLREIELQIAGPWALMQPSVYEGLGISLDVIDEVYLELVRLDREVDRLRREMDGEIDGLRSLEETDPNAARTMRTQLHETFEQNRLAQIDQADRALLDALTPAQRFRFERMQGKPVPDLLAALK